MTDDGAISERKSWRSSVLLAGIALTLVSAIAAGAIELRNPEARTVIPFNFSDRPLAKWENGLLLTHGGSSGPDIIAFDRSGAVVVNTRLHIPGAATVMTHDIASRDARVVVAGGGVDDRGARASFIAWLDRAGKTERVVRTGLFAAARLCFAPDGTLWAFGRQRTADYQEESQYDMLRQYDARSGELIRSVLPRSMLAGARPHPAAGAFMSAGPDRITLFTRQNDWIEVSLEGAILKHRKVQLGGARVGGLAVTAAGIPLITVQEKGASGESVAKVLQVLPDEERGIEVMRDGLRRIFGADGEYVVGAIRLPEVLWLRVKAN